MGLELNEEDEQLEVENIQNSITEFKNMDVNDSNYSKFKNIFFTSISHISANYENSHIAYKEKSDEIKNLIENNTTIKEALQSTNSTSVVPKLIYDKKDEQLKYAINLIGHLIMGYKMSTDGVKKMFKIYDINDAVKTTSSALKQLKDMVKDSYTVVKEQAKLSQDFQNTLQQENMRHINNLFNEVKTSNENNTRLLIKAIETISDMNKSNNRREIRYDRDEDKNDSFKDIVVSKPLEPEIKEKSIKKEIIDKPKIKENPISKMDISDIPDIPKIDLVTEKDETDDKPDINLPKDLKDNKVEEKKEKIITEKDVKFKLPEIPNFGDESGVGVL